MSSATFARQRVPVLALDPDLGAGVSADEWKDALRASVGELVNVPGGPVDLPGLKAGSEVVAVIVFEGILCREQVVGEHRMFELLGPGDPLYAPAASEQSLLAGGVAISALGDARLIVLDALFIRAAARWPTLLACLQRRFEEHRERLAIQGAITHFPRASERLLLLLWHLAERWGRVTPDGITLSLPLTHQLLGHLIAARRPTVTQAVLVLEADGLLRRHGDRSWLLTEAAGRKIAAMMQGEAGGSLLGEIYILRELARQTADATSAVIADPGSRAGSGPPARAEAGGTDA